jgi:Ca2+-binding EF-hand superfamily protein
LHQRFQHRRAELDNDGDGALDRDELATARDRAEEIRDGAQAQFDADGDGVLSAEEHADFQDHARECVREGRPMSQVGDSIAADANDAEVEAPGEVAGSAESAD